MTIQERINKLDPRTRKKLETARATCHIRLPDGTAVKCCTFVDPIGLTGHTERIDYIPREEQEEMINRYIMPGLEKAVTDMCEKNPAFRASMMEVLKKEGESG